MDKLQFKISSALKDLVGKDLIRNDNIAVFELVKNSYDAFATKVEITFKKDRIVIADNGKGMTLDDLKNKWLFLAYSAKKDGTEDSEEEKQQSYRDNINRHYAGAKGVGRFSCDRLGENLVLTTKSLKDEKTQKLIIDWKEFEKDQKQEFVNIEIPHEIISDSVFFPERKETGTILEITNLRENWDRKKILELKQSLEKLINPFSESLDFSIEIICEHEKVVDEKAKLEKKYDKEDAKVFGTNFERVTFHPNYSYAQFVGTYKPTMSEPNKKSLSDERQRILSILQDANKTSQEKYDLLYENFKDGDLTRLPILLGLFTDDNFKTKKADGTPAVGDNSVERNHGKAIRPYVNLPVQDSSDEKQITYQYVPGPFMRIYAAAKQNPNNNYLLLIEEINRANVAAVFGDVFQLLDRKNGISEYPVAASEDIQKYLAKYGINERKLSIPSNMYIWATMNSADQGVFPMDTAFKRRWEFEYIGIDENAEKVANYDIPIGRQGDKAKWKVKWDELRRSINDKLISLGINEDKLLGPYFLSESVLESAMDKGIDFVKSFESKVLMYLFEDAAKMKVRQLFKISSEKYIYSEVCKEFEKKGVVVFDLEKYPDVVDIASSES